MSEFDVDLMAATPDGRVSLTMSIAQLFKLHRQAVDLTKGSPLSRVKLETARLSPSIPTGKSTSVDGVAKRLGAPKLADSLAYPPRGMRADRAAAYLGMSTSTFLRLVGHSM